MSTCPGLLLSRITFLLLACSLTASTLASAQVVRGGAQNPLEDLVLETPGEPSTPIRATGSAAVLPAAVAIRVDGILDEAAWAQAEVIELPFEWLPGDNVEAPVRTECRVTYDAQNLYFGCTAYDPEPQFIRANYTDRDQSFQDDHLVFLIDPFNDQRRAFQFRVNPFGVQMDALFAQGFEDFSWDAIWASAGRITDEGYVVEVAIPFKSLRFPRSSEPQTWGMMIERSYPRSSRHRMSSTPRNRADSCVLCQGGHITGLQGIAPGRDVEVNPTLTMSRTDTRGNFPVGGIASGDPAVDPGLNLRWGVTPNVSLNATINPDFSQVEADVGQLAVNQRFAITYPEKRPFFLEGADLFQTFVGVVNTRKVVDPTAGLKITGKEGRDAIAAFVTHDRVNNLLFPGEQRSRDALLDEDVTTGVVRYQRDVGRASSVGLLYAGRHGREYQNHVASADAFWRISASNTFRAQVTRSLTEYPDEIAAAFEQPEGAFTGNIFIAQFNHNSRHWSAMAQAQHLDDTFRGDAGHLPRMGVQVLRGSAQRIVWGGTDRWFNRLGFTAFGERLTGVEGVVLDQGTTLSANYQGARQSTVNWSVGYNERFWNGETFGLLDTQAFVEVRPSGRVTFRLSGKLGDEVDFANTRKADIQRISGAIDLRPGRHLNLDVSHTLQRLATREGAQIFQENLTALRAVYNLNARTFVRGMLQYHDVRRDPELYVRPVPPQNQRVSSQLLFAYKVNPQTVVFVGYADTHRGELDYDLTQENRNFFMKLSYALRP
jgi:hypothetical protein